jgi:hypothetical protein
MELNFLLINYEAIKSEIISIIFNVFNIQSKDLLNKVEIFFKKIHKNNIFSSFDIFYSIDIILL